MALDLNYNVSWISFEWYDTDKIIRERKTKKSHIKKRKKQVYILIRIKFLMWISEMRQTEEIRFFVG